MRDIFGHEMRPDDDRFEDNDRSDSTYYWSWRMREVAAKCAPPPAPRKKFIRCNATHVRCCNTCTDNSFFCKHHQEKP